MRTKKHLIFAIIFVVLIISVACISMSGSYTYTKTGYALNTVVKITLEAKNQDTAEAAAKKAFDEISRVENLLSCHIEDSEISRINNLAHKEPQQVSAETYNLLVRCMAYNKLTQGAFDITVKPLCDLWNINSNNPQVPSQEQIKKVLPSVGTDNIILKEENSVYITNPDTKIDLGGVAKGYAADRVKLVLEECGIKNALVDLGGNIYAMGNNGKTKSWSVGIQKPFAERGQSFHTLELSDSSAVTSGAYERYFKQGENIYHHIIDPQSGYPANSEFDSVTIVSPSSELADMLSTAVYIMGEIEAESLIADIEHCYGIMLKKDGTIVKTNENKN